MTEETAAIDAARKKGKGALNELHGAHGERRENTKDDWRGEAAEESRRFEQRRRLCGLAFFDRTRGESPDALE